MNTRVEPYKTARERFAVSQPGQKEVIKQPLYDHQTYLAAGQTSLTFFQLPIGQSSKTLADTNMHAAGQLPNGVEMVIRGMEVLFMPAVGSLVDTGAATVNGKFVEDVYTFFRSGAIRLFILQKDYLQEAPIGVIPALTGLDGFAALSDATTAGANLLSTTNYASIRGKSYDLVPIFLTSNQNFSVSMEWPTAVALPSGADARVAVRLIGEQYRSAQ